MVYNSNTTLFLDFTLTCSNCGEETTEQNCTNCRHSYSFICSICHIPVRGKYYLVLSADFPMNYVINAYRIYRKYL